MLVDFQSFLARLEELLMDVNKKPTFRITFKQFTDTWKPGMHRKGKHLAERKEEALRKNAEGKELGMLVRIKVGKAKMSTMVPPDNSSHFQKVLHNLLLVSGLGKRKKR